MRKHLLFHLKKESSAEDAMEELLNLGIQHPYVVEEDHATQVGGWGDETWLLAHFRHVDRVEILSDEIDWKEQWDKFAPQYNEIDLSQFGGKGPALKLKPGPGFGNLSHPTTRLMLRLMAPFVAGRWVVDIGCGSGILTCAAILMGAKRAIGLDIDEDALKHARENAHLNEVSEKILFARKLESAPPERPLVLMNMIFAEQVAAWEAQIPLHNIPLDMISSGILKSQRKKYLSYLSRLDLKATDSAQEDGWLAFSLQK